MLLKVFAEMTNALYAGAGIAIGASFVWGVLSILLSPCHLSSIPLIIGFVNGQGRASTSRAFVVSALFSSGILVSIAVIGSITGFMGRILGDVGQYGNYFVAVIFFVVGLSLMDIIKISFPGHAGQPALKGKGLWAAFVLGLIFGIALGPCTFAYMIPVLTVAFNQAAINFVFSFGLVMAYALGHCGVIVLAGTSTKLVQNYLNWNEGSGNITLIKRICGFLVILGGIYLLLG